MTGSGNTRLIINSVFFPQTKKEEEEEGEEAGSPHTCTSGHIFRRRRGRVSQQRDGGRIHEQTPPKETVGPEQWCLCGWRLNWCWKVISASQHTGQTLIRANRRDYMKRKSISLSSHMPVATFNLSLSQTFPHTPKSHICQAAHAVFSVFIMVSLWKKILVIKLRLKVA